MNMSVVKLASIFAILASVSCDPMVKTAVSSDRGAGFLFVCLEDKTIFLGKRSRHVSESGVWSVFGGGAETDETDLEAAKREVIEEAGSMPKIKKILYKTEHKKQNGFVYTTFIADVSLDEKQRWKPELNFETEEAKWFDKLPDNLHPGLRWTFKQVVSQ